MVRIMTNDTVANANATTTVAEPPFCIGRVGPYRTVNLSKTIDPKVERRRCQLHRHATVVQGVEDYYTDVDIVTHLGTHVEAPYHHGNLTKDVVDLSADHFVGRGVLLKLDSCEPRGLIRRSDLDAASRGRVRSGDVVILDSPYQAEPFIQSPNDQRPDLSRESAEWFLEKQVRAVGFGNGVAIENNAEHCVACHDILLGNDILFIEVMKNLDKLQDDVFLIIYMPLPIRGLDSSPVNVMAIEGIPGFTPRD
jgi:arylformamidase